MNLDFTRLDSIAPRMNGEAPGQPEPLGGHTEPPSPLQMQADYERIVGAAKKIIAEYKLSHEIAEGCRLQILQDIENRENPYRILLCAAEAIGRLDFRGDDFFLQVQQKLIEVYGRDVSEDRQEGQETA